jgi:hypothetical protein
MARILWLREIGVLLTSVWCYSGTSCIEEVAKIKPRVGASEGETAIIELSAHHAVNLGVRVERAAYRNERIALIRHRLDEHAPSFVVFYGRTYQAEYERLIGAPFAPDGTVWRVRIGPPDAGSGRTKYNRYTCARDRLGTPTQLRQ